MVKSISSFTDGRRELSLTFVIFIVLAYCIFANTFANEWTMDDFPVIVKNHDVQSFGNKIVSWISSLLFLVHPIQVEVVANISHRKESLVLAFSLFSLLAYMKNYEVKKNRAFWIAGSFSLAVIACLAKESAVLLPLIFLAYELIFINRNKRVLLRYPILTLLVLVTCVVVFLAWLGYIGGLENIKRKMHLSLIVHANHFTYSEFVTWYPMVLKSWVFMVLKLLFPLNLAVEYVYPVPESWLDPWVISAILIVIIYILSLYLSFRRHPVIFFALFWFAAFLIPLNLLPLSYFAADRYLYAPSVGFFILVALFMNRYLSHFRKAIVIIVFMLVFIFSILTWRQNKIWHSTFTLYSNAVRVSPNSAFALHNLGWVYYLRNDLRQAIYLLKKSASVNPYSPMPLYSLGKIYEKFGDREKAIYYYSKSLKVSHYMPGFFEPIAQSIKEKLRKKYGVVTE
jgi:hypothetical protein